MKIFTKTLLATSLVTFLLAGQTAMAGEEAPRDAYSIGLVWTSNAPESIEASRVNYSLDDANTNNSDSYFESKNR